MVCAVIIAYLSVSMSVTNQCLLKWLNIGSCQKCPTIDRGLEFCGVRHTDEIPNRVSNAGGVR